MTTNKSKFKLNYSLRIFIVLVVIGAISFVVSFITNKSLCVFYNITGIPCPSCGMTRAFRWLLDGSFSLALRANPLFLTILVIPVIGVFEYKNSKLVNISYLLLIALFITVWIVRLIIYFPNEPMLFNPSSLIYWLFT